MPSITLVNLMYIVPSFIVAIVILVGFHELGHFWMARRLGIRVLKFSIGFGKPLWKKVSKQDGVEYVVAAIPLGGYVKLLGERNDDDQPIAEKDLPFAFNKAPVWKRVLVLLAGPMANLILAAFIYWILLMVGVPALKPVVGEVTEGSLAARAGLKQGDLVTAVQGHEVASRQDAMIYLFDQVIDGSIQLTVRGDDGAGTARNILIDTASHPDAHNPEKMIFNLGFDFWRPKIPAVIGEVAHSSAAERAGLQVGDQIVSVNGQTTPDFENLAKLIMQMNGRDVLLEINRGGTLLTLPIHVAEDTEDGKKVGRIGVRPKAVAVPESMQVFQRYSVLGAVGPALTKTWDACALDLKVIGQMLMGKLSVKNLSGTVGIAEATGQAARAGLLTFISFLAFISINLGILNLLPIPVLDGGQIVYQLIELVKGSPVSERVQLVAQQIGLAALLMLISLTLYNDIARHLS
jgi:regulator of sigma E protease